MTTKDSAGIHSPAFWIEQWDELQGDDTARVSKGYASADYWDAAAKEYDTGLDRPYYQRLEDLVTRLEKNRMLKGGTTVLDVGCGTGSLAFLLADHGAQVTAVDFAEGMLQQAWAHCPDRCKNRVRFEQADWKELDLKDRGWLKNFDLVLAHMTPAVKSPDLFLKMMTASRQSCCATSWAGKRENNLRLGLWHKIMEKPLQDHPADLQVRFNLLYAMGYFPDIFFTDVSWQKTMPVEAALNYFFNFFKSISTDPETILRKKIRDYLEQITIDGKVVKKNFGRTGTLCWRVDKNDFDNLPTQMPDTQ